MLYGLPTAVWSHLNVNLKKSLITQPPPLFWEDFAEVQNFSLGVKANDNIFTTLFKMFCPFNNHNSIELQVKLSNVFVSADQQHFYEKTGGRWIAFTDDVAIFSAVQSRYFKSQDHLW